MLLYMTSQTLGPWFVAGTLLTAGLLWYEHMIVKPGDLKKVNVAFFNLNGMISVGLMVFVIVDTVV
jgi:4-hydroxybenzoate polyprenyltransferase